MTKDVLITFSSIQSDIAGAKTDKTEIAAGDADMESNIVESVMQGLYYKKNEKHYLLYDEVMEGFKEPVKTKIIFEENALEIIRSGPINVHMFFEENKANISNYNTPYGNIPLGINTKKISVLDDSEKIAVSVEYLLESENEPLSNCNITLKIQSLI